MKARRILARISGILILYVLLGAVNLFGLLSPEVREQMISLGAVIFRYSGFVFVGVGLLLLKKWAVCLWGLLMASHVVLLYAVYEGPVVQLEGWWSALPWVGPILIAAFFYYLWPALKPEAKANLEDGA